MYELKVSEKYMLSIKEASAYFSIGEKKLRRMSEDNDGGFALYARNRYLSIRPLLEKYFTELALKGVEMDEESDTGE